MFQFLPLHPFSSYQTMPTWKQMSNILWRLLDGLLDVMWLNPRHPNHTKPSFFLGMCFFGGEPVIPYLRLGGGWPWMSSRSPDFFFFSSSRQVVQHEPRKKPSYFPLYWMVNRDPYFMVYYNPYITG